MKNIMKGVMYVLFAILLSFAKGAKRLGEHTNVVERVVNKSTQVTKKIVNENLSKLNWKLGGVHAVQGVTRSNARTTSQPHTISCARCGGNGFVTYNDGYTYHTNRCSRCNGTGKMVIR